MIMGEHYHLNWDRHLPVLSDKFGELIGSKKFSDVTLVTKDGRIPAHRLILSTCSPFFNEMFEEYVADNSHPIVILNNSVDYDTMCQLLKFMYSGNVEVKKQQLPSLLEAADTLKIVGLKRNLANPDDVAPDEDGPEEVQRKELDLSSKGPSRQYSCPATPASFAEERTASVPKLLAAPQKAHLNHSIINHTAFPPLDNALFNTATAIALSSPQYLSTQVNSPSRPNLTCPNLPKQSPLKSRVDSPKRQSLDALHRDNLTLSGSSRRFSNSPEESANSNASLDLTKASTAISPLNRLAASVNPLSSLVSAGHTPATQADIHHAIASKLHQFQQMQQQPQIRVSQTLLSKRSRSRSPESIQSKMAKIERNERDLSPGRYPSCNRESSPQDSFNAHKQTLVNNNNNNSSGGSSSEHNNYSEDESGDEGRAEEPEGRDRSVSPGPSTSTPTVTDAFNHTKTGFNPLGWNYPPTGEDSIKPSSDPTSGSADIMQALMRIKNAKPAFDQHLLQPSAALFAGLPGMSHFIPNTIANIQAAFTSVNSFAGSGQTDALLKNTLANPYNNTLANAYNPHMAAMLLADHERAMHERVHQEDPPQQHQQLHNTGVERNRNRKKKSVNSTGLRYNCDACTRSYASHGNLKRHKKYECGQPPTFKCPCCPVMFQHRHSMKIHLRSAHKEEYERMTEAERNPEPLTVPQHNETALPATPITNVPCQSPSSSPTLEIAEEYPHPNEYPNGGRSMPSVSGSAHLGNTHSLVGEMNENSVQLNSGIAPRTIATAEVSVASVSPENLDHKFVAMQRAQSQSSNTDNV